MSRAFGLRIGLTAGVVLALALGLAATLTALTAARTASGLAEARWLRETSAQAQTIGRAVAVGLPLSALTTPGNALADLPTQRSDIAAACVVDEREVAVFGALSPLLIAAHFKVEKPTLVRLTPGRTAVLQPVLGSHGERAGTVAIVFDRAALRHAADHFNRHCQKAALLAWVVAVVLAGGLAAVTQRQLNVGLHGFADIARFRRRLLLSFGSLLLAALTGFGMLVRQPLLSDINQQIHTSIEATAKELATTFARIAASGAPLDRLRGMDQLLASVRQDVPEIETLTVSLPHGTHYHDGTPVDSLRAPALRLAVANAGNAVITVHIRAEAGRDHARTVAYDLLTVAVVTVLVAWELLGFALSHAVVAPLMRHNSTSDDGGYGELYRVRLPLFLMIFSEAMALPFLPLLARSLDGGEWLALPS